MRKFASQKNITTSSNASRLSGEALTAAVEIKHTKLCYTITTIYTCEASVTIYALQHRTKHRVQTLLFGHRNSCTDLTDCFTCTCWLYWSSASDSFYWMIMTLNQILLLTYLLTYLKSIYLYTVACRLQWDWPSRTLSDGRPSIIEPLQSRHSHLVSSGRPHLTSQHDWTAERLCEAVFAWSNTEMKFCRTQTVSTLS